MTTSWRSAIEYGIALGLVVGMCLVILPTGSDDFTRVFWRVGQGLEPVSPSMYWYPFWNTWALRPLAVLPREVGLVLIWLFSIIVVLKLAPVWGTPAWAVLLCPVFIVCLGYGQPFEAVAFCGLTLLALAADGHGQSKLAVGIALLLFKPQIGFLPAIWGCWLAVRRRWWVVLAVPALMAVTSGGWWVLALRGAVVAPWNDAPRLDALSLFWLIPGGWLLVRHRVNRQRQLWIATLLGFLLLPYWVIYSTWPLVAMAGYWNKNKEETFWNAQ